MGVLFTFPSRYYFAIGHPGVFSLARWSLLIHTGFHVPHATRVVSCLPWIQQQFERLTYSGISGSMLFSTPRSISSLATPFLVSGCLGIHRKPFLV
ncbi:hypothetical protein C4D60_Mb00t03410 [Musa balbisiana]|uniref:Uncharacterized protein n=1 Tax=Musa balbisiana TaxID=52838 RepID=A0A4V4H252_MUSBA|nr:hypothetical protein C4D60_Mb00t03410 [Musa balbisiana]